MLNNEAIAEEWVFDVKFLCVSGVYIHSPSNIYCSLFDCALYYVLHSFFIIRKLRTIKPLTREQKFVKWHLQAVNGMKNIPHRITMLLQLPLPTYHAANNGFKWISFFKLMLWIKFDAFFARSLGCCFFSLCVVCVSYLVRIPSIVISAYFIFIPKSQL